MNKSDPAKGSLIGALVGDAAGATLEFLGRQPTPREVENALKMVGGGVFGLAPGQITDDGELTLALAQAIEEAGSNDYSPFITARWYRKWMLSEPFDVGYAEVGRQWWTPSTQAVSLFA